MRRLPRQLVALAVITTLMVAAGCSSNGDGNGDPEGDEVAFDQVTYLTSFGNFGRDSYAWVALHQGFFEEVGIEVEILPGQGGENLAVISGGQAQFAVADITSAMFTVGQDDTPAFTIVAAIYQNTITGLMTLEENEIAAPADLEGRTIGDASGSVNVVLFPTYASLAGIDESQVEWFNAPPPELPGLLANGNVDVIGQFAVGEPLIELAAEGRAATTLPYSDYLTDLYGVVLFTSTAIAEDDPDLVRRFSSALLRGLEYAIENPEEAGAILAEYDDAANAQVAARELELLAPFVRPLTPGDPFGVIDEQRVARSIALLEGAGSIEPGIVPSDLVTFELAPTAGN